MTSLHQWEAIKKANRMGGYAGHPDAVSLWDMSKRELVEIAIRLAEMTTDSDSPSVEDAIARVREEHRALKANNII